MLARGLDRTRARNYTTAVNIIPWPARRAGPGPVPAFPRSVPSSEDARSRGRLPDQTRPRPLRWPHP